MASDAAHLDEEMTARPRCPQCAAELNGRGEHLRELETEQPQQLRLARSYATCPRCGVGLFPLGEELGLLPGKLTPRLQQAVVRLGTWLPFERAAGELEYLLGVQLSEPRVRRLTEKAGAAMVQVQAAEVARLERETPRAPVGPALQLLSVDGAMVPLVGRAWTEVKPLALGAVTLELAASSGEQVIKTSELSYFSRCLDSPEFTRQALVETQRRGLECAARVAAVCDGAEGAQKFIDYHRPDAVRILDFPHGAEYVAACGRSV